MTVRIPLLVVYFLPAKRVYVLLLPRSDTAPKCAT